jgi:hypothetical protein
MWGAESYLPASSTKKGIVGQHLQSFSEFPPRQKPGSFSLRVVVALFAECVLASSTLHPLTLHKTGLPLPLALHHVLDVRLEDALIIECCARRNVLKGEPHPIRPTDATLSDLHHVMPKPPLCCMYGRSLSCNL